MGRAVRRWVFAENRQKTDKSMISFIENDYQNSVYGLDESGNQWKNESYQMIFEGK